MVEHLFPSDGEYEINIADMVNHIWGNDMEFENPVVVTVDGQTVYETVVGGEEDQRLYDQVQDGVMEKINARLKNIRFAAKAGPHKVGVTFAAARSRSPTISCSCTCRAAVRTECSACRRSDQRPLQSDAA